MRENFSSEVTSPKPERGTARKLAERMAPFLTAAMLQAGCGENPQKMDLQEYLCEVPSEADENGFEHLEEGCLLVEDKTEKPLKDGEKQILREVLAFVPEVLRSKIRVVTINDMYKTDGKPMKDIRAWMSNKVLGINRLHEPFNDFSHSATLLQQTVLHESGHIVEFFKNAELTSPESPFFEDDVTGEGVEKFANLVMKYISERDRLLLLVYPPFSWRDNGPEGASVAKEKKKYEWLRDNLFEGEEFEAILPSFASIDLLKRILWNGIDVEYEPDFTKPPEVPSDVAEEVKAYLDEWIERDKDLPLAPLMRYTRALAEYAAAGIPNTPGPREEATVAEHERIVEAVVSEVPRESIFAITLQLDLAYHYFMTDKFADAARIYEDTLPLVRSLDKRIETQHLLASAYEGLGQKDKAVAIYSGIIEKYPDTGWANNATEDMEALNSGL